MTKLFHSEGKCPGDQLLAAYADQQLVGDERHEVEKHLVGCDKCLRQLGSLVQSQDLQTERTPDHLLRAARQVAKPSGKGGSAWRWIPIPLVAMLAFVAFTIVRYSRIPPAQNHSLAVQEAKSSPAALPNAPTNERDVRGAGSASRMILSPKPNERISPASPQFSWQRQPDAEYYDVQLMTENGDLVWQSRADSTSVNLPRSVHLIAGRTYFLLVRTHARHSGITESAPVQFTVG
jgi:hypothetical protein